MLYIGTRYFTSLPILSTLSTMQGSKRVREGGRQGLKLCKRCFREFENKTAMVWRFKGKDIDNFVEELTREVKPLEDRKKQLMLEIQSIKNQIATVSTK